MKTFIGTASAVLGVLFLVSFVFANPASLPKHPGYPIGNPKDPVRGQSLGNDPGQTNAVGMKASIAGAGAATEFTSQKLSDPNNQRLKSKRGAGRLPRVDGPEFFAEPPVKEATRMK